MCVHVYLCVCPCVYILSCSVMSNSCDPIECNLAVSSVHGILQARILEWVAISFPRESSQPRNQTWVSCIAGRFFTDWAMREVHVYIWIHTHTHTHTHTHIMLRFNMSKRSSFYFLLSVNRPISSFKFSLPLKKMGILHVLCMKNVHSSCSVLSA